MSDSYRTWGNFYARDDSEKAGASAPSEAVRGGGDDEAVREVREPGAAGVAGVARMERKASGLRRMLRRIIRGD
jgi:hypothetical protein